MDKFILTERSYKKDRGIKDKDIHKEMHKEKDKEMKRDIKREIKHNEKEIKYKELEYLAKPLKREHYLFNDKIAPQKIFDKELFLIKENGDNLLNNWLKTQKDPLVVFLSEFIPNTKISKELEKFKPIIKTTPVISIEEYRKKKKIGEEGVQYLKKLKEKYGNIVLKVLWANLHFKS
jgi:hypothetical protein